MMAADRWNALMAEIAERMRLMPPAEAGDLLVTLEHLLGGWARGAMSTDLVRLILETCHVVGLQRDEVEQQTAEWGTTFHEAGHAFVGHLCGLAIDHASVWPGGARRTLGRVRFRGEDLPPVAPCESLADRAAIERVIMVTLAGPLAEHLAGHFPTASTWRAHAAESTRLARRLVPAPSDGEITAYLSWLEARTLSLLKNHWGEVVALAEQLHTSKELSGEEIGAVLECAGAAADLRKADEVPAESEPEAA